MKDKAKDRLVPALLSRTKEAATKMVDVVHRNYYDILGCLLLMCASGLVSIALGQDFNWDLQNYHLYNAYSFLHNRLLFDIDIYHGHKFFNPLMDLPYYFLIKAFNSYPRVVAFFQGIYLGAILFFIYKIFVQITRPGKNSSLTLCLLLATAGTGAITVSEIGTTFNDLQIALLVILAVYLYIRMLGSGEESAERKYLIPSVILGISFGLKATAVIYLVGAVFAVLITARMRIRIVLVTFLGLIVGFLISDGYWAYVLYHNFGNPLFPLLNDLFKSEWWLSTSKTLTVNAVFGPENVLQWILYPFYWIKVNFMRVTQVPFSDPRVAGGMVSVLVMGLYISSKKLKDTVSPAKRKQIVFLITFFLLTYITWLIRFSIYRYALLLEILSVLMMFVAAGLVVNKERTLHAVFAAMFILCIPLTSWASWGRVPFSDKVYEITIPEIEKGSVIIVDGRWERRWGPPSWLFTFFDRSDRFIVLGKPSNENSKLGRLAFSVVYGHEAAVYFLVPTELPIQQILPELFGCREITDCGPIQTNVAGDRYKLCKLTNNTVSNSSDIFLTYPRTEWLVNGDISIRSCYEKKPGDRYLVIESGGEWRPYFGNNIKNIDPKAFANGIELKFKGEQDDKVFFELPEDVKTIEYVRITSSTFNPFIIGINKDYRNLGIDIKSISVSGMKPHQENILTYPDSRWLLDGDISVYPYDSIESGDKYIVIESAGNWRDFFNNDLKKLDLRCYANNVELMLEEVKPNAFYFRLPAGVTTLENMRITSSTFNPKRIGLNNDSRDLGVDIKSVSIE